MDVVGFDWDDGNLGKCQKHGVSIEEIETLLANSPCVAPDLAHSDDENRFIAVGQNAKALAIFLAFTFLRKGRKRLIRPVSARYMHRKESEAYDKKND